MHLPIRRLALGLALAVPAPAAVLAAGRTLGPGVWGGDKMILEVVSGGADVEFECAGGRIDKPIKLDRHGDFDLAGTFGAEGRGPTRDGDSSAAKARYQGHVEGNTMTLTMTHGDQRMGPFTLTRDRRPFLRKCR